MAMGDRCALPRGNRRLWLLTGGLMLHSCDLVGAVAPEGRCLFREALGILLVNARRYHLALLDRENHPAFLRVHR